MHETQASGQPPSMRKSSATRESPATIRSASSRGKSPSRPPAKTPSRPPSQTPKIAHPPTHAVVSRSAADRLRTGHLWVYATEIDQLPTHSASHEPTLVPVTDSRDLLLGTALFSPASQIPLRMIARESIDESAWLALLADRLRSAIHLRRPLLNDSNTACRLVFSEADLLPGLILDKYADLFLLQLLVKPLASSAVRSVVIDVLRELFDNDPITLWERPDPRIRLLEGLEAPTDGALWSGATATSKTVFQLNGLRFHYDAAAGQKTGAFLDQRENYAAAARWAIARQATGKALDVCTYQGGFALHLAQVCRQVTGVDASRAALEVAEANLGLNRAALAAEVDWIEADAFTLLRDLAEPVSGSAASRVWDCIILDPPAFAKSRRAVEGALRGYKELNLRALRMLRHGGLLVTCSCSHHIHWTDLESAVASAAIDAHRRVRILERRGAAIDHPVLLNLPETEYLKCLICEVLD